MGNIKGIPPGDVQRMSAGTGVTHSEFNHAKGQVPHFLQIWIVPNVLKILPGYEQKTIPEAEKRGKLRLVASLIACTKLVALCVKMAVGFMWMVMLVEFWAIEIYWVAKIIIVA